MPKQTGKCEAEGNSLVFVCNSNKDEREVDDKKKSETINYVIMTDVKFSDY